MNKKNFILLLMIILPVIIITSVVVIVIKAKNNQTVYEYTNIKKQNISNIISSTGTLEPVGTVEVGTQVSGTIKKIYVSYNGQVKKGDLLAVLDTTLLEIAVKQAKSNLINKKAQYRLNDKVLINKKNLLTKNLISEYEYETALVNKETSYAEMLLAETNLQKAEADLDYAYIKSPIDGMVLDKNIEEGQTVSANLSAPTLFVLAKDLTEMEIHALVDESDISQIKKEQKTVFTVDAFEDKEFQGTVKEIRLNPTTESNVVNYSVIIFSQNKEKLLYPGMTTTIDFIIEESQNAYIISNTALRFVPSQKLIKNSELEFNKNKKSPLTGGPKPDDNLNKNFNIPPIADKKIAFNGMFPHPEENGKKKNNHAMIWFINDNKRPDVLPVTTGITDGQYTELVDFNKALLNKKIICSENPLNKTPDSFKSSTNKNKNQGGPPPHMF